MHVVPASLLCFDSESETGGFFIWFLSIFRDLGIGLAPKWHLGGPILSCEKFHVGGICSMVPAPCALLPTSSIPQNRSSFTLSACIQPFPNFRRRGKIESRHLSQLHIHELDKAKYRSRLVPINPTAPWHHGSRQNPSSRNFGRTRTAVLTSLYGNLQQPLSLCDHQVVFRLVCTVLN